MKNFFFVIVLLGFSLNTLASRKSPIYEVKTKTLEGQDFNFKNLQGKVALIVNTASNCGYTPQLAELEELHKIYGPKGLVVIAVPSNDFKQELSTATEIKSYAEANYKTSFTFLDKQPITGPGKSSLFKFLTDKKANLVFKEVQWNFEKFLVSREGEVLSRWNSQVKPKSTEVTSAIEGALQIPKKSVSK